MGFKVRDRDRVRVRVRVTVRVRVRVLTPSTRTSHYLPSSLLPPPAFTPDHHHHHQPPHRDPPQCAQLGLLVQGMLVLVLDRHAATRLVTALLSHSSTDRSEQEHGSIAQSHSHSHSQSVHHHHDHPTSTGSYHPVGYGDAPRFLLVGPHGGDSSEMYMHATNGFGDGGGASGGVGGGAAGVAVGAHGGGGGGGVEIELGSEATFMGGICLGLAYGLCVAMHQLVGLALVRRLSVFGYALNEGN